MNAGAQFALAFVGAVLLITITAIAVVLIWYLLFSQVSPLRKRLVEKKLNKLVSECNNFEIMKIGKIDFFYDKQNRKFTKL